MTKISYVRNELGGEVQAPWGYYQPLEEGSLEYEGREVLYTLGSACVEVSCCGHGSWNYARVEGFVTDADPGSGTLQLDTVEAADQRAAIAKLVREQYPEVRVEFR